jgi:hypothetical protein
MALEGSTAFLFKIMDTTPKLLQNVGMFNFKHGNATQSNAASSAGGNNSTRPAPPLPARSTLAGKKVRLCLLNQNPQLIVCKRARIAA